MAMARTAGGVPGIVDAMSAARAFSIGHHVGLSRQGRGPGSS